MHLLCRLEEITDITGMEVLQRFDTRMEAAAQVLMRDEWLEDIVAAGGSPAEILRLPSSQPTKEVSIVWLPPNPQTDILGCATDLNLTAASSGGTQQSSSSSLHSSPGSRLRELQMPCGRRPWGLT